MTFFFYIFLLPFVRKYFQTFSAQYLVFVLLRARAFVFGLRGGEEGRSKRKVRHLMRLILEELQPQMKIQLHFRCLIPGFKIQKNIFSVSYQRGFSAHSSSTKKYALEYSICSADYITNFLDYSSERHCNY